MTEYLDIATNELVSEEEFIKRFNEDLQRRNNKCNATA